MYGPYTLVEPRSAALNSLSTSYQIAGERSSGVRSVIRIIYSQEGLNQTTPHPLLMLLKCKADVRPTSTLRKRWGRGRKEKKGGDSKSVRSL